MSIEFFVFEKQFEQLGFFFWMKRGEENKSQSHTHTIHIEKAGEPHWLCCIKNGAGYRWMDLQVWLEI
jgi:hypothetical protein